MRKNARGERGAITGNMYGRFRSNDDNTRRKEFTDESGEIINRCAVTPFILTARVTISLSILTW